MKKILILAVTVNLLCGSSYITAQNNIPSNLNISVLLDLSDRIDTIKYSNPSMEFYQRDLGYLKSVAKTFTSHMLKKRVRQWEDKIQLYRRTVRGKLNLTWQARILTSGKGRVRISTKEQNIKQAERIAISKYQELEARVQNNLPIERYRFRYAAIRYLEELIKEEQGHTPKYLSQHSLIANQLIPYFNNTFPFTIKNNIPVHNTISKRNCIK